MPIFTVPTSDQPFYTQKTALDGVNFTLSFAYNQREDRWYLSIADDEETPIVSGIKILANFPLLFRFKFLPAMPPGEMVALDTTKDGSPPGAGELGSGKRVRLVYFDAAWVAEFQAGVASSATT